MICKLETSVAENLVQLAQLLSIKIGTSFLMESWKGT